jgi:hypothetical protein
VQADIRSKIKKSSVPPNIIEIESKQYYFVQAQQVRRIELA